MENFNMNQLSLIKQFLGDDVDMEALSDMAKKAKLISGMMNMEENSVIKEKEVVQKTNGEATNEVTTKQRQINALSEAISYLDYQYQKPLYTVLKLIEINNFKPSGNIYALESGEREERKQELINIIDSCLNDEERKKVGVIFKMLRANSFFK